MALIILFTVLLAAAELMDKAAAATYVVGDSLGWRVPSGGPTTYTTWASQHVFRVGDVLVFNFPTGIHDVAHVTKAAYDSCSSTNPIELATLGPASLTLNSTGEHYYICTFGQHCPLGQKLAINVTTATSISPAPPPTQALPPTITPTPMPTTSPSSGPTPSSSPTITPSPTPMTSPSLGPTPYPAPSSGVTPASELSPGSAMTPSSLPTGDLSQPPSCASVASFSAFFVLCASIGYGFLI